MNISKVYYAVSDGDNTENLLIAVFDLPRKAKSGNKDRITERGLIVLESDDKLTKILKNTNFHNFVRTKGETA